MADGLQQVWALLILDNQEGSRVAVRRGTVALSSSGAAGFAGLRFDQFQLVSVRSTSSKCPANVLNNFSNVSHNSFRIALSKFSIEREALRISVKMYIGKTVL